MRKYNHTVPILITRVRYREPGTVVIEKNSDGEILLTLTAKIPKHDNYLTKRIEAPTL